VFVISKAEAES